MLTELDVEWLKRYYLDLLVNGDCTQIKGKLLFTGAYNKDTNQFLCITDNKNTIGGIVIEGSYRITIIPREADDPTGSKFHALIFDTGQLEFDSINSRHFNFDGTACVSGPVEEEIYLRSGYKFKTFFNQFIIPFLYEQSYYDIYKEWPWGEYGHGSLGIFASYFQFGDATYVTEIIRRLKKDRNWSGIVKPLLNQKGYIKGHTPCWCGSNQVIRKCHPEALQGMNKFRNDMRQNNIHMKIQ